MVLIRRRAASGARSRGACEWPRPRRRRRDGRGGGGAEERRPRLVAAMTMAITAAARRRADACEAVLAVAMCEMGIGGRGEMLRGSISPPRGGTRGGTRATRSTRGMIAPWLVARRRVVASARQRSRPSARGARGGGITASLTHPCDGRPALTPKTRRADCDLGPVCVCVWVCGPFRAVLVMLRLAHGGHARVCCAYCYVV